MNEEKREVQLAYVTRYRHAYRGRYLENGEYRNGPVFQTEEEANFWAQHKREELERRASGDVKVLPHGFYKTIPLGGGRARRGKKPSYDIIGRPGGNWISFPRAPLPATPPEDAAGPSVLSLADPEEAAPAVLPTEPQAAAASVPLAEPHEATPAAPSALGKAPLEKLDSVVHDFVASLDQGALAGPSDGARTADVDRFLRLLADASSTGSRVLGPPVLFGASPSIGLDSLLGLLGSLQKTGILRVKADDVLFTVSVVKGYVVHGVSDPRPEPELLGNLLVARGTIAAERLARFFAECGDSVPRIAEALERQALVSTAELRDALEHQLQLLFDRLLATRAAEWCFHEGEATLAYIDMRMNVISMLLESARKSDERR